MSAELKIEDPKAVGRARMLSGGIWLLGVAAFVAAGFAVHRVLGLVVLGLFVFAFVGELNKLVKQSEERLRARDATRPTGGGDVHGNQDQPRSSRQEGTDTSTFARAGADRPRPRG